MDKYTAQFEQQRDRLTGLAYRMLGTAGAAEDVVQDAWLRWRGTDVDALEAPEAWLVTVTTRLAIDRLRRERRERERYQGPWLPEPLPPGEPVQALERSEALSVAFLLLLEQLSPAQRASFLLREVFDYAYADIARVLGQSEDTCRQQVHRARRHLRARRPPAGAEPAAQRRLLQRFAEALADPTPERLHALLAADAVHIADGGGLVRATLRPLRGAERLVRLYVQLGKGFACHPDLHREIETINGEPALVTRIGERIDSITWLVADGGRIATVYTLRNPDKLARLNAVTH